MIRNETQSVTIPIYGVAGSAELQAHLEAKLTEAFDAVFSDQARTGEAVTSLLTITLERTYVVPKETS